MEHLLQNILVYAIPTLFAITLHEAAHGYAALKLGDDTAYRSGRISLNPVRHIDPIGTVVMPLLLLLATSGSFVFGYAKPVPVDFRNLNNPKRDMIWVALAGPMSNFVQALLWGVLMVLLMQFGVLDKFTKSVCDAGIIVNAVMFAFNLFPMPPLDGGRIVTGLLPHNLAYPYSRIEPWGFFIVMALVIGGVINTIWMQPVMSLTLDTLQFFLSPFLN